MNDLRVQDFHGIQVIDSRDVAQMVSRSHKELLRTINTYIGYLSEGESPSGAQRNFAPGDFFIESTYLDGNNQQRPNYLITKKGCDMIANKTTGKKGVLFTAAYVTAFEEMRQVLTAPRAAVLPDGVTFSSAVGFMRLARRVMLDMGSTPVQVGMMMKETLETCGFPVPTSFKNQLEGQLSLFDKPALEGAAS